jgi:hypothetical protein
VIHPLSLFLFDIVDDVLGILITQAKEDGKIGNLVHHLFDGGIFILQYAYDNIMYMEHDLAKAVNMNLILCFLSTIPFET